MTTPYSEPVQQQQQQQGGGQWYQFDPNIHYYYDEQNQLHYYDPNTNLDVDYQPQYETNAYYPNGGTYTQPHTVNTNYAADISSSRQGTPDVFLPCPEPTCDGQNKPKSKFCEECGRPLGAISRSVTPASVGTPLNNMSTITRAFSQQQINNNNYYSPQQEQYQHPAPPQAQIQRPPTAPVYSSTTLDSAQTVPLYHPPSAGGNVAVDPRLQQQHLYYNGVQHQSMQDLYGLANNSNTTSAYTNTTQQRQYSPSVDPLGRARGCPIVTFGFGGKMLVTFPSTVTDYYSSTVKPQPGPIKIRSLKQVLTVAPVSFPGPILFDSKVGTKQKKRDVAAFMTSKMDEFEKQKLNLGLNTVEYHQLQSKILLWQLVKVLMESEGHINDKDKMDQAILEVLRPTITNVEESHFSLPAYNTNGTTTNDDDLSEHMLSKLEQFLINGNRKGAVDYAIQEDLWAHALIISSCVDKELWQRVIANFVDREMNATPEMRKTRNFNNIAGNNQALRVIYSLFSGAGGIAMNEFLKSDLQHINTPYGLQTVTPPADWTQLVKWRDTLAILLANRTPRDTEALTAFGDILKEQGWIDAAHICYLLSPQNSMHSGIDTIQVRLTLVGSDQPSIEAYQLTEIFEFAHSLHNGGAAACLPFLQGYKLQHAWVLADFGLLDEAERYHDSIDQSIKTYTKGSPYLNQLLLEQAAAFGVYLESVNAKKAGVDPGSWLKPKFQKKALTSLWGSLEGSFTKFVNGEEIQAQEPAPSRKSTEIMSRPYAS